MGIIKKLAPDEIQKIAAGEVVERPANIVKELVENSLDAGATSIAVYAQNGGKTLIRVVDNGLGISKEDIDLAITHHATSKLTTVEELDTIATFGFRGEALSSISSVSRMNLITRDETVSEGTRLVVEAGQITGRSSVARDIGTDISVADLFFNVPARRKFLKSDDTEWNAIYKVVHALALAHVTCGFKLYHNDRLVFHCQLSDTLINRAKILFQTDALTECAQHQGEAFSVTGFVSNLHVTRYDRSSIFIFANRRWIKNSKLTHSFIKGYAGTLPPARYPCGALFIEIAPELVDVNIHPRKEEISFLHPRRIELALEATIKKTLEKSISQTLASKPAPFFMQTSMPHIQNFMTNAADVSVPQLFVPQQQSRYQEAPRALTHTNVSPQEETVNYVTQAPDVQMVATMSHAQEYRLIGQLRLTYIMIETAEGMLLVDQHAAHERILYELFANRFHEVAVISLMFPLIMTFTQRECALLEEHKTVFSAYGLCFENCGVNQYALTALPVVLHEKNLADLLHEFLSSFESIDSADQKEFKNKLHHHLRAQMACKAAVKAGDILPVEQMQSLIDQLNSIENRFSCPHGRPTIWNMSFSEIERKFKRRL